MQLNTYLARQLQPLVGEDYEKLGPVVDEACRKADADRDRRWLLFEEWLELKTENHSLGEGLLRLGAPEDLLRLSKGSPESWEEFLRAFHLGVRAPRRALASISIPSGGRIGNGTVSHRSYRTWPISVYSMLERVMVITSSSFLGREPILFWASSLTGFSFYSSC